MQYQLIAEQTNKNLLDQILKNRNITTHYFATTEEDLYSPLLLNNIEKGAKCLIKHVANNDIITIIVDSDADGFTSAAALVNYLHNLFPACVENNFHFIFHMGKQHGLNDTIEQIPIETKLVICPDSSSEDEKEHEQLTKAGIDVLVLDHHECTIEENYSNAIIINNNNSLDNYPNKSLSGVGIVYKFCSFIDSLMNTKYIKTIIDLVAIGIVSDMMDLTNYETKFILDCGFRNISNPLILALMDKNDFQIQGELTPFKTAFYITPYINATIRMGEQKEKELLFEALLFYKANEKILSTKRGCKGQLETKVEQACRNCTNIKNRQTKAQTNNYDTIENYIQDNHLTDNKILVIPLNKNLDIDKRIVGLLANKLMAEYKKPTLLLNEGEQDWAGSMRAPSNIGIENFRDWLLKTELVEYSSGHACAAGVAIAQSNLNKFINKTNNLLKDFDFSPSYQVDAIIPANKIDEYKSIILDIADLDNIWGQGIEQPLIAIENLAISVDNITLLSPQKSPTIKITLPNSNITFIKFKSSQEEFDTLYTESGRIVINIIGEFQKNKWNGNVTPQIIIKDYEIIDYQQYYF